MARIDERNPNGAEGEWFIDERCIGCGSSASVAPGLIVSVGDKFVFERQPETDEDVDRAWLARELCPTRSIGTETRTAKRDPFPHLEAPGIYRNGHNDRASFGAHSYFAEREAGNVMFDSPRYTFKLAKPFEEMGGISTILLSHRDDVADAQKWAEKNDAEVVIHSDDAEAAPFATKQLEGIDPTEVAPGIVAIPVPGHTKGSVVYIVDETFMFSGDSLAWSHSAETLTAFRSACWYSWDAQIESIARLSEFDFEQVFAGHGASSPRMSASDIRAHLDRLVEWMKSKA